jgi:F0F1-type ATP synthase epsilon subunit
MQFSLATPEDSKKILSNASKVKVHLTTGIIEILDKHQDLLGKVEIDLLEIETNEDNKNEKFKFILQDALVIVSTKGLTVETNPQTGVYIFAKRVLELNSNLSLEEFSKKVEQKSLKLETEKQALGEAINSSNSSGTAEKIRTKMFLLEDELEFDKKVLSLIKESRN